MVTIIFLSIVYVISVIVAYRIVRAWHIEKKKVPDLIDILFMFLPIANIIQAFDYGADISNKKFIRKFFRLSEDDGGGSE